LGSGRGEAVDLVLEERLLLGGASRVGSHQVSQAVALVSQRLDRREVVGRDRFGGLCCLDLALVCQRDANRCHLRFAAAEAIGRASDGLVARRVELEVEVVAGGVDAGSRAGAGQADVRALGGRE
jgi:hypothetical protein